MELRWRDFRARFKREGVLPLAEAIKIEFRSSSSSSAELFTRMEYRILNTLFTKQVNKWPNLDVVWTFIITGPSKEYDDYREAKGKLLADGLINETTDYMIFITRKGFKFCKEHYDEIKDAPQWWHKEQMNPENLRKVMFGEFGPKD